MRLGDHPLATCLLCLIVMLVDCGLAALTLALQATLLRENLGGALDARAVFAAQRSGLSKRVYNL